MCDWPRWSEQVQVISPVDDMSAVLSETVSQPASSLSNVDCRWTFDARQTINHVVRDAGKMSPDVNMPFSCCIIVVDELTWGNVRQMFQLNGKVAVGWFWRFRGTAVGCFWLTDPSDSWHARKPSVGVFWKFCWLCCCCKGSGSSLKWNKQSIFVVPTIFYQKIQYHNVGLKNYLVLYAKGNKSGF